MHWLWYVSAAVVVLIYVLTGLPGRHERRRDRELARWRDMMRPMRTETQAKGYRDSTKEKVPAEDVAGPRLARLPRDMAGVLQELGGGQEIAAYELHEKLAYVAVIGPDMQNGSEYQAVVAKLEEPAPSLRVRPLPIIDGKLAPNLGIKLKKDPELTKVFEIKGSAPKPIAKWLSRRVRDALRDMPYAFLVAEGKVMVLAIHGPVDADRLYALVNAADAIFEEHGAEGGPSLFFDEDEDEERGERDEGEDEDEDEDAKPAKDAKAAKGAKGAKAEKAPAKSAARAG